MHPLFEDIRHTPLLWLLIIVPFVFLAQALKPEAHTLLFLLSVAAIVPLAALLSLATESVAAKTGDLIGGLLNATLGNLTELLITLAALRAGQYVLVKASIAGAIITNTLFMLGASFLLGGLKHHIQEYNRDSARLQGGMLFLATIAILVPSVLATSDNAPNAAFTNSLSVGLSVLLIVTYGLGLMFSLKTHRELFTGKDHHASDEKEWPMSLALATLALVTVLVALVSEVFVESVQQAGVALGITPAFRNYHRGPGGRGRRNGLGIFRGAQEQAGPERGHRARQRRPDRAVRCSRTCSCQLPDRPCPNGPPVLARRDRHDADRQRDGFIGDQHGTFSLVRRRFDHHRLHHFRNDPLPASARWSVGLIILTQEPRSHVTKCRRHSHRDRGLPPSRRSAKS
jgi:Ca2+/Na+ antiporter